VVLFSSLLKPYSGKSHCLRHIYYVKVYYVENADARAPFPNWDFARYRTLTSSERGRARAASRTGILLAIVRSRLQSADARAPFPNWDLACYRTLTSSERGRARAVPELGFLLAIVRSRLPPVSTEVMWWREQEQTER